MTRSNLGPKVVDFSTHLPGPVCSRHLAQLGADVIKVEHPKWGDGNRKQAPYFHDEGVHHLHLNAGTRSFALSPSSPGWSRAVQALARWADVVIVGNRPENAKRMGIDPGTLMGVNPQLVYCLITGYGLDGEWAGLPAHGLNMDALAGTLVLEEDPGRGLPDVPAHFRTVGTTLSGVEAALGIYAALRRRDAGEGGQVVHVSVWEAAMSWQWRDLVTQANCGHGWGAYRDMGSRYSVYNCSDGKAVLVCPVEKHFWERFCDIVGLPSDVRARGAWEGGSDFGEKYLALGERESIQARIGTRPRDEWVKLLAAADIPVAPILHYAEAMDSPHAQSAGLMARYEYGGRSVQVSTTPVSVTAFRELDGGTPAAMAKAHRDKVDAVSRPPHLGEHNEEICRALGISI